MKIANYKITKKIGEGGFGEVYQAEHILVKEMACVKINKEESEDAVELLKREAKLLWGLSGYHSIPSVMDFAMVDKTHAALITTFIDGKTLDDLLERGNKHMHPEDACWITERLLSALHFCHHYGIIHSDVKPENVFVEPAKDDIKLIDFGLAAYKPRHSTSPLGYTPRYAAPELANGNPPIPETDLYGAGIVMLYALGGDVEKKSFRDDTPKELVDFCNELLRYDPADRPNWGKVNLMEKLSDARFKVFGRRHRSG